MNDTREGALEKQVEELTALVASQAIELTRLEREHVFTRALLETMSHGVVACDGEGQLVMFNRTSCEWHGMDAMRLPPEEWAKHYDLFEPDGKTPLALDRIPLFRALNGEHVREAEMVIAAKGQAPRVVTTDGDPLYKADGSMLGAVVVMTDITARKEAEAKAQASILQEEIIRVQEETLAALSTPLIPISDGTLILPLIGALDSRRAERAMEAMLEGVVAHRASFLIIDVTGVATIDTQVAASLMRAAHAVSLVGARVSLTGIRPEMAMVLVGLDVDLQGITTYATLENAVTAALREGANNPAVTSPRIARV